MKTADLLLILSAAASLVVIVQFMRGRDVTSSAYALNPDNWLRIEGVPAGRLA